MVNKLKDGWIGIEKYLQRKLGRNSLLEKSWLKVSLAQMAKPDTKDKI
jgi:hypothetical protein